MSRQSDTNMVLVNTLREVASSVTSDLFHLTGCVYNDEDASKMQLGLTKYLLEMTSQIMVNNYNRFADGRTLFYLASQSMPDEVDAYERNLPSDLEDEVDDDDACDYEDDQDDEEEEEEEDSDDEDGEAICPCENCECAVNAAAATSAAEN